MKISLWAVVILSLQGCNSSFIPFKNTAPTEEGGAMVEAAQPNAQGSPLREDILNPRRSVDQLLLQRLTLCNQPEEQRHATLDGFDVTAHEVNGVDEKRLSQLLLASCDPAVSPGVLNQLLADLTTAGTWPEEYAAFFDLLITGQRAYAAVEKVYLELKSEHEKTIQGLSEIEAQIEMHSVKTSP